MAIATIRFIADPSTTNVRCVMDTALLTITAETPFGATSTLPSGVESGATIQEIADGIASLGILTGVLEIDPASAAVRVGVPVPGSYAGSPPASTSPTFPQRVALSLPMVYTP